MQPQTYLKAVVAAIAAGLGVAFLALADNTVSAQEWVAIAQAALVAGGAVYGVPNLPPAIKVP